MSETITRSDVYLPKSAWQPDSVNPALVELAEDFHFLEPDWSREYFMARSLSRATGWYLDGDEVYDLDIGRAGPAIANGAGNCIAHTEIGLGVADDLELDMMVVLSREQPHGWHASTLWLGKTAVWEVDFLWVEANEFGHNTATKAQAQTLGQTVAETQQGAHFALSSLKPYLESELIEGQPGESPHPYLGHSNERIGTIMPEDQGMQMLAAFVDYHRYKAVKPEHFARTAGQIRKFIPPGVV